MEFTLNTKLGSFNFSTDYNAMNDFVSNNWKTLGETSYTVINEEGYKTNFNGINASAELSSYVGH
jgi:hypothetical protein